MNDQELLTKLNGLLPNTLMDLLEMRFVSVNTDAGEVVMSMPVNNKVHQPMGLLHGGAIGALVESVGSASSLIYLNTDRQAAVGIQLQCNHIKSKREGMVYAHARIIHKGRSTHLWEVKVRDEQDQLLSDCSLTNMVIDQKNKG